MAVRSIAWAALGAALAGGLAAAPAGAAEAKPALPERAGAVDDARLGAAPDEAASWLAHGRTWSEQRMSPLAQIDASTGALLWRWDPQVSREVGQLACCDVVNRGVAVYRGRVYVGTLDGRLVALDAAADAGAEE